LAKDPLVACKAAIAIERSINTPLPLGVYILQLFVAINSDIEFSDVF